jgi:hypothetical protein
MMLTRLARAMSERMQHDWDWLAATFHETTAHYGYDGSQILGC